MKLVIRRASLSDLNEVLELERQCFDVEAYDEHLLRSLMLAPNGFFVVAEVNNRIAGYVSIMIEDEDVAHLISIAVKREFRRKGIASKLLEFVTRWLVERGICNMMLEVKEHNEPAKKLYLKHGFIPTGVRKNYYSDGSDAIVMYKRLC